MEVRVAEEHVETPAAATSRRVARSLHVTALAHAARGAVGRLEEHRLVPVGRRRVHRRRVRRARRLAAHAVPAGVLLGILRRHFAHLHAQVGQPVPVARAVLRPRRPPAQRRLDPARLDALRVRLVRKPVPAFGSDTLNQPLLSYLGAPDLRGAIVAGELLERGRRWRRLGGLRRRAAARLTGAREQRELGARRRRAEQRERVPQRRRG